MLNHQSVRSIRIVFWMVCSALMLGFDCVAQRADVNYDEKKVPSYHLPDPLVDERGVPVASVDQWQETRRPQILRLFEDHVYGRTPKTQLPGIRFCLVECDSSALKGKATRKQVSIYLTDQDQPRLDLLIYLPNHVVSAKACFLGLNFYGNQTIHLDPAIRINTNWMRANDRLGIKDNRATANSRGVRSERWQVERVIAAGFALATLYYGDIDPDSYQHDFSDGVHPLFYRPGQTTPEPGEWGSIGAWAWGLSQALDYLEFDCDIDGKKVSVIGHSRLGKTALWAAAQDQRFAMVISNNSGCGGAALFRRCFGERIQHMVGPIGYWFCKNHHQYAKRENDLPVDQHMLIALMAPRPVYVASASEDGWADPRGEFLAAKNAESVYRLFGLSGIGGAEMPTPNQPVGNMIRYHLRRGEHDVTAYDWDQYLEFAAQHLVRD